jgi:hypothetical protein
VKEVPGLPLTIGLLMVELVNNTELGCKVAAEGFNGPTLDPFIKGRTAR